MKIKQHGYLFLIFALILCAKLFSQSEKNISFGPKLGLSLTQVSKNDIDGRLYKPIINIGGVFNYHLNNYFSLGTELYFSQHVKNYQFTVKESFIKKLSSSLGIFGGSGTEITDLLSGLGGVLNDTIYSRTRGSLKISTLEIPLMANLHIKNLRLSAGAYAALKIKAVAKEEYKDDVPFLDVTKPIIDSLLKAGGGFVGIPGLNLFDLLISPVVPNYKAPKTEINDNVSGINTFAFGFVGDISYLFDKKITLNARINIPFSKYKPHPNAIAVRNTLYTVSIGYLFGKGYEAKSTKALYDTN